MPVKRLVESGEWQSSANMVDYRMEWPGDMLVERTTWAANSPENFVIAQQGEKTITNGPGYIWFRFWLPDEQQIVERYFDADGEPVGTYVPICTPLERHGMTYSTIHLALSIWLNAEGSRVTVLHEAEFDAAVQSGEINPIEEEQAELRIRELTTILAQTRFPPAIVRNFTINVTDTES